MSKEIFHSAVRSTDGRAGVFEYDGETGYFYLYDTKAEHGQKVCAAIHMFTGAPDLEERHIAIRWTADEGLIGLFIRQQLWAAFDANTNAQYGGGYRAGAQPEIPLEVARAFEKQ